MTDKLDIISDQLFSVLDAKLWDSCYRKFYFTLWFIVMNNTGQHINNTLFFEFERICDE